MSRVKILLAEDNLDHKNLLLLALVRGRPRVDVTVVGCGTEFLNAIKRGGYDCTILDYILPDYAASELIEAARPYLAGCPVLVVSSCSDQRVVINAMRSGSVDFLPKDQAVRGQNLWDRVEASILRSRHAERDRRAGERRERRLARASETDHLTGLYNRRYLDRQLADTGWVNDRRDMHGFAMVDVDHFKSINDTYGHAAGDRVLKGLTAIIKDSLHPGDSAIRYGGEEFLVIRSSADMSDMWLWAEKLRRRVAAHHDGEDPSIAYTISAGVACARSADLGGRVIEAADQALYMAKDLGRNQISTWDRVWIDREIDGMDQSAARSIAARLDDFIGRIAGGLGPTQHEHLTSHAERVSDTAVRISRRVSRDQGYIGEVCEAALLHDAGKCLIPESLLAKPRSLSIDEWQLVALHTDWSAWIADRLGATQRVVRMVRGHHDRYDAWPPLGARAASDAVLLGAQIICVADALVTMTTDRPYRAAKSVPEALSELNRERGKQFHPHAVDAVMALEPASLARAA